MGADQIDALREGHLALGTAPPHTSSAASHAVNGRAQAFFVVWLPHGGAPLSVVPLAEFAEWRAAELRGEGEAFLGFCDPCPLLTNPGWPLRNLLVLAGVVLRKVSSAPTASVRVICFREPPPGASATVTTSATTTTSAAGDMTSSARSIVIKVTVPACDPGGGAPSAVGWERNGAGKMGPRFMDLSAQMNPQALAEV